MKEIRNEYMWLIKLRIFIRLFPYEYHVSISSWWLHFSSMSIGYECRRSISESMDGLYDKIVDHYAEKWSNVFALSLFDAGRRLNSWPPMLIRSVTENMSCALATRTRNTQGACARQDDQHFFLKMTSLVRSFRSFSTFSTFLICPTSWRMFWSW